MDVWDVLTGIGTVLDTPRAMAWSVPGWIAGSGVDPLTAAVDPSQRTSGWDLMESLGIQNQPGFDLTDIGAVASELALDPLNLMMGGGLLKRFMGAKAAEYSNAFRAERLAAGGMPEEIAQLTKMRSAAGPSTLYHRPDMWGEGGESILETASKAAEGPATYLSGEVIPRNPVYVDVRNPFPALFNISEDEAHRLAQLAELERRLGPPAIERTGYALPDTMFPNTISQGSDYPGGVLESIKQWSAQAGHADEIVGQDIMNALGSYTNPVLRKGGYDAILHDLAGYGHDALELLGGQMYSPSIAPALQQRPDLAALLGLTGAYNAARLPSQMMPER